MTSHRLKKIKQVFNSYSRTKVLGLKTNKQVLEVLNRISFFYARPNVTETEFKMDP